jgi:hypothetical protein
LLIIVNLVLFKDALFKDAVQEVPNLSQAAIAYILQFGKQLGMKPASRKVTRGVLREPGN